MIIKLLIIDDDPELLNILSLVFTNAGYDVQLSRTVPSKETILAFGPAVILMDDWLQASEDGSQVCRRLKADQDTMHIRIVLMSAHNYLRTVAGNCQADNYVNKPFDLICLTALIQSEANMIPR